LYPFSVQAEGLVNRNLFASLHPLRYNHVALRISAIEHLQDALGFRQSSSAKSRLRNSIMCRQFAVGCLAIVAFWIAARVGNGKDPEAWLAPTAPSTGFVQDNPQIDREAIQKDKSGFRGIYQMNPDGSDAEYVVSAPGMLVNTDPQLSHDGKLLAFAGRPSTDALGESKLYITALEGPFKGVIRNYGYGIEPAWSPDDQQIAYLLNGGSPEGARAGLWLMNADGSHRRFLADAMYPRWSPDGKQLLCHIYVANGSSLSLVDPTSGKIRDLLEGSGWNVSLYGGNWSPDGKRIVFVGSHEGSDRLATFEVDDPKSSIHVLFNSSNPEFKMCGPPAWSPDCKQIVLEVQHVSATPQAQWTSYLHSLSAEVPSAPVLIEGRTIGNVNRGVTFSPDGKKLFFSSER
jgi:Tol biopolymer transport system component